MKVSEELSDSEYRDLHRQIQQMALQAYPNPDRVGCPGRPALEEIAALPLSSRHPLFQEHISRCSPCLAELLELRGQNYRRKQLAKRNWWIAGASLAAAAAVLVAVLFARRTTDLKTEAAALHSQVIAQQRDLDSLQKRISALSNGQSGEKATPSAQIPAVILLKSGISRSAVSGNENQNLSIPAESALVVLLLALPRDTYPRYDAVIETVDGKEVGRVDGLTSQPIQNNGRAVVVGFPSQTFSKGSFIVRLLGRTATGRTETVDGYSFRVLR